MSNSKIKMVPVVVKRQLKAGGKIYPAGPGEMTAELADDLYDEGLVEIPGLAVLETPATTGPEPAPTPEPTSAPTPATQPEQNPTPAAKADAEGGDTENPGEDGEGNPPAKPAKAPAKGAAKGGK
ncbi:MAG: hypothetical protein AAF568_06015 [Pseudomonadota bacterium]